MSMRIKEKYQEYLDYLQRKGLNEKTIKKHRRYLFGALSHSVEKIRLKDLKLTDTAKIIEAGSKHGKCGAQDAIVVFRMYLKFLRESGLEPPFDWRDVEVPNVPAPLVEYLTPEEIEKTRKAIPLETLAGLRTRTLFETLLHTGLRITEAISLNREDVDWQRREAKVLNVKTKEWGMVFFNPGTLAWLKRYLKVRKDELSALFISGRGRLMAVSARNYLCKIAKKIGIKKHLCHHICRRTFATKLIFENVDIKSVQTLLRHKSERTTLRYYIGVDEERMKKLHQKAMKNF